MTTFNPHAGETFIPSEPHERMLWLRDNDRAAFDRLTPNQHISLGLYEQVKQRAHQD